MIKEKFLQDLLLQVRPKLDAKSDEDVEGHCISELASTVCSVMFLLRLETKDHEAEEVRALDLLLSRAETKAARLACLDPQLARAPIEFRRHHTAATDRSR